MPKGIPQSTFTRTYQDGFQTLKHILDNHMDEWCDVIRSLFRHREKQYLVLSLIYEDIQLKGVRITRQKRHVLTAYILIVLAHPSYDKYLIAKRPNEGNGIQLLCYDSEFAKGPAFGEHLINLFKELQSNGTVLK